MIFYGDNVMITYNYYTIFMKQKILSVINRTNIKMYFFYINGRNLNQDKMICKQLEVF